MSAAVPSIAIIGGGISGLSCAYLLSREYDVTLYEAADQIGGHTATKKVEVDSGEYWIDTGFIVYNDRTYPNFIKLMDQLGVQGQKTEMGFSVSCEQSGLEYAGTSINGLFAQRRNLLSPQHWSMLKDIVAFNRHCTKLYEEDAVPKGITLAEFLQIHQYSPAFSRFYLLPMVSAIWSSGTQVAAQMPLEFFIRFFHNHGLLTVTDQPQWYTLRGGSHAYLEPLTRSFQDNIVVNAGIEGVTRTPEGVNVQRQGGMSEHFDHVIFACHSDQALALLRDPSATEIAVLSAIPYKSNRVVLHTDTAMLPSSRRAWASWNYRLKGAVDERTLLTYNMNILQCIEAQETFCVTVNPDAAVNPARVLGEYEYAHPVFTLDSVAASARWAEISGAMNTHYCGAYWHNGFHEDGLASALRVAKAFGVSL